MMKFEFEALVKCDVSYDDYKNIFEPMYNRLTSMDKEEFAKMVKPTAKALAAQREKEKALAFEHPVFVSSKYCKTVDGLYYVGHWYIALAQDINVKAAKMVWTLRELTDAEADAWYSIHDCVMQSDYDVDEIADIVKIIT